MFIILRRKIFEDEPTGIHEISGSLRSELYRMFNHHFTISGVPDVVQRERPGGGAEVRAAVSWRALVTVESCEKLQLAVLCV